MHFSVLPGQLLRIGGENGSGKTSLLRILCGLLPPAEGEVRWHGEAITLKRDEFHREMTYIGHANGLKDDLTASENIEFASTLAGTRASSLAIRDALDRFGIAHCARLPVRHLSQGQRRRVALARLALPNHASLWVLDEPFTALDAGAVTILDQLLANHVADEGMVVLTTHQEVAFSATSVTLLNIEPRAAGA